jgi:hypothetical protein
LTDARCESCVFWVASAGSTGRLSLPRGHGQCRRNPPVPLVTAGGAITDQGMRAAWPLTAAHDWCGEHAIVDHTGD